MGAFITLTCPTCGGKLQITSDLERFACVHCGNEHLVRRGQGVVSLVPVVRSLDGLRVATDRTASELAIRRIQGEMAQVAAAMQEARNRLGLHRAKLAEHDYRRQEWRGCFLLPALLLGSAAGYFIVEAMIEATGVEWAHLLSWSCAGIGILLALGLVSAALKLAFADPIRPTRRDVEGLIASTTAEISRLDSEMSARRAEFQNHLAAVRNPPVVTRPPASSEETLVHAPRR